jgi:hypothetical protein
MLGATPRDSLKPLVYFEGEFASSSNRFLRENTIQICPQKTESAIPSSSLGKGDRGSLAIPGAPAFTARRPRPSPHVHTFCGSITHRISSKSNPRFGSPVTSQGALRTARCSTTADVEPRCLQHSIGSIEPDIINIIVPWIVIVVKCQFFRRSLQVPSRFQLQELHRKQSGSAVPLAGSPLLTQTGGQRE